MKQLTIRKRLKTSCTASGVKRSIFTQKYPKLDEGDYADKLTEILRENDVKSVHVVRMEVPCCGGIENAVRGALQASGKWIPWQVTVVSTSGEVLDET